MAVSNRTGNQILEVDDTDQVVADFKEILVDYGIKMDPAFAAELGRIPKQLLQDTSEVFDDFLASLDAEQAPPVKDKQPGDNPSTSSATGRTTVRRPSIELLEEFPNTPNPMPMLLPSNPTPCTITLHENLDENMPVLKKFNQDEKPQRKVYGKNWNVLFKEWDLNNATEDYKQKLRKRKQDRTTKN